MPDIPWEDWTDDEQKATRFYTNFLSWSAQRLNTSELWSAIRGLGEEGQGVPPGITFRTVNAMRRLATGQRRAAEVFNRASDDAILSPRMVADTPWSAPEEIQQYTDNRYVLVPVTEANGQAGFRTFKYGAFNQMPTTKGDLLADITRQFQDNYPGTGVEPNFDAGVQLLTGPAWVPRPKG